MGSDITSIPKKVGAKVQQNVIDPIREAPNKVTNEIDRGITSVGNYPTKIIDKGAEYLSAATGGVGQAAGDLIQGVTPAIQGLVPVAQDLLGTYLRGGQPIIDPNEYLNRKEDFTNTPIITSQVPNAGFDFSSLITPLIIVGGGIAAFMIIKSKK